MSEKLNLATGTLLKDNRKRQKGRVIRLVERINPVGTSVPPYWKVKNVETGRESVIREDRITAPRWDPTS